MSIQMLQLGLDVPGAIIAQVAGRPWPECLRWAEDGMRSLGNPPFHTHTGVKGEGWALILDVEEPGPACTTWLLQ